MAQVLTHYATSPHPCDGPNGCGAKPGDPCTYRPTMHMTANLASMVGTPRINLHADRRRGDGRTAGDPLRPEAEPADGPAAEYERVSPAVIEQPAPVPNDGPSMHDLVIADFQARKALGLARYKALLQSRNGRIAVIDAYQEQLDWLVYMRQMIEEDPRLLELLRQRVDGYAREHGQAEREEAAEHPHQ